MAWMLVCPGPHVYPGFGWGHATEIPKLSVIGMASVSFPFFSLGGGEQVSWEHGSAGHSEQGHDLNGCL